MQHCEIVDMLAARGVSALCQYPDHVAITIGAGLRVVTGGGSCDYGAVERLERGMWQPTGATAEPAGLTETTTDPATIADAWAAWVGA